MYKLGSILIVFTILSCGRTSESESAHEHEAAEEQSSVKSTVFSDTHEFYIEYDALTAGHESAFLVHVTNLETYKPLLEGSLQLTIDGQSVAADSPEQAGIFHLSIVPSRSGDFVASYQLRTGNFTDALSHAVDIEDSGHAEEHAMEEGHDHEAGEAAGEINFLKEQAWKSDFMVQKISTSPFSAVVHAGGQILAVPGEKKNIPANISGILHFREKALVQGSWVEKGQVLFTIKSAFPGEDNFEQRYKELKNMLEQSRSEFERHRSLFAEHVIPERTYIESRTKFRNDSIRFYTLASTASVEGVQILSPGSGYIHELNFSEGEYVDAGDQIVTISNNRKLLLRADVAMQNYPQVKNIRTASFRTAYSEKIYEIKDLNGSLLASGSSVAENDQFIPVFFTVENDGTLLEGAYVEFFLKTSAEENALSVPVSAIAEEQGVYYVYKQISGESFSKQAVKTGDRDGKRVEILSGIRPGDRIVTEGVMLLKAASMLSGEVSHGHSH